MNAALGFDLLRLVGVAVLVLANAFFVAAEFALVSVRPTRVEELLQLGRPGAGSVKSALQHPDRFIAATQLGITMASLGLGWLGEPALGRLLEPLLALLPAAWVGVAGRTISAVIAFIVITFMHVVVGELMPKSIALQRAGASPRCVVARPTLMVERIFKPFIGSSTAPATSLLQADRRAAAGGHEMRRTRWRS